VCIVTGVDVTTPTGGLISEDVTIEGTGTLYYRTTA
jgi:hypothetical protein